MLTFVRFIFFVILTFSFLSTVFFVANIAKVSDAINLLSEAANSAGLEADELNQVQASLNTVKQLLELLANVGEGSG